MHTASYEFLMKPKESAGCHQTLSARVGSGDETSGVAKLGHTGARALATGGCAPPVQALLKIIGAECTVINGEFGAKSAQRC